MEYRKVSSKREEKVEEKTKIEKKQKIKREEEVYREKKKKITKEVKGVDFFMETISKGT